MINKKWLVTIDLDGTLLKDTTKGRNNYAYNEKNKEVIKKLQADGHKVAIVTGRPWRDTAPIYESLGLDTIVANYNGAHIHLPNNNKFIDLNFSMNGDLLLKLLSEPILKKVTKAIIIETLQGTYALEDGDKVYLDRLDNMCKNFIPWKFEDGLTVDPQTVYIGINYHDIDPYEVLQVLKRKYGNSMLLRLWDERSNGSGWVSMEINQIGANKATAMKYIATYYNIPLKNTIAFGDGLNDKEMLFEASMGVAMKNAKGTIKTYAKDTTDYSNNDGGVGRYLEEFFS